MKIVAVTACPTGIAHTYMAAEKLCTVGQELGHEVKVETQGAMGIENPLSSADIAQADVVIFAVDIAVEEEERFEGKRIIRMPIHEALKDTKKVFAQL